MGAAEEGRPLHAQDPPLTNAHRQEGAGTPTATPTLTLTGSSRANRDSFPKCLPPEISHGRPDSRTRASAEGQGEAPLEPRGLQNHRPKCHTPSAPELPLAHGAPPSGAPAARTEALRGGTSSPATHAPLRPVPPTAVHTRHTPCLREAARPRHARPPRTLPANARRARGAKVDTGSRARRGRGRRAGSRAGTGRGAGRLGPLTFLAAGKAPRPCHPPA